MGHHKADGSRRKTFYIVGFVFFGIMFLGTVGAEETGSITLGEAIWQSCVFGIGALWFLNMIRIEERRACRN